MDWKGILINLCSGGLGALIVLFFSIWLERRKEEKEKLEKYRICLQATRNELAFYAEKLGGLLEQMNTLATVIPMSGKKLVTPSYTLYPKFLERSKIKLNSFFKNSDLVKDIGHCHFELCHVVHKLDITKRLISEYIVKVEKDSRKVDELQGTLVENLKGLIILIKTTRQAFDLTVTEIDHELSRYKST